VIIAGLGLIYAGPGEGVEFAGGVGDHAVRPDAFGDAVRSALNVTTRARPGRRRAVLRRRDAAPGHGAVPQVGAEEGASLGTTAQAVEAASPQGNLGNFRSSAPKSSARRSARS
jgi:hypothetical protein